MEISIIVPIYNAEKHLRDSLDSICKQIFLDYEVLMVNDGSTDNSLAICRWYEDKNKRWKTLHKPYNEGVERARLDGLQAAQGKYIFFLDADDWLEHPNVLSRLYHKAEETLADYVEIGVQRVFNRRKWIKKERKSPVIGLIEAPKLFQTYYHSFFGKQLLSVNIWGKLYRKSTIDKLRPKPLGLAIGEDLAFNLQLFPHLQRIYILEDIGYNYRYGGMTCGYNPHLYPDLRKLYILKEELIARYHYIQALDSTRIEMTNVLRSDILQQIHHRTGNRTEIYQRIQHQLEDSLWEKALIIENASPYMNQPFVEALTAKDIQQLYALCEQELKTKWFDRLLEQLKNKVFTSI